MHSEFDFFYNLPYRPEAGLGLHLTRPKGEKTPLPLVLLVHGGAWCSGNKDHMLGIGLALTSAGYACATMSYTFSQVAPFPAAIRDVKCAIRFLRTSAATYGLAPDRFGLLGISAGGHLVSLAGTAGQEAGFDDALYGDVSSAVQAVVNVCGPTDFLSVMGTIDPTDEEHCGPAYFAFLAGPEESFMERNRQASPVTHITPSVPPFLVIHGEDDPIVPVAQADAFVAVLQGVGVEVEYLRYPETEHDVFARHYSENLSAVRRFFDKYLTQKKRPHLSV